MELKTEYYYSKQGTKLSIQKISAIAPIYSISGYLHEVQKHQTLIVQGINYEEVDETFVLSVLDRVFDGKITRTIILG